MPCDPEYLANIRMFEHLNEDDRIALASVVNELKIPAGHTLLPGGRSWRLALPNANGPN
jgi:hypothetical protein